MDPSVGNELGVLGNSQRMGSFYGSTRGIIYSMLVLIGNGVHPIINNGRPADFDVLIFTWMMAAWECAFSILFLFIEKRSGQLHYLGRQGRSISGHFKATTFRLVIIGLIFTVATYYYVLGLSLAGSISGSIALKTSPIYAMLIGAFFLNEKVSKSSIFLTAFMLLGLYYMATEIGRASCRERV